MTFTIERKHLKLGTRFIKPIFFILPDCSCEAGSEISRIVRYYDTEEKWISFRCPKCKMRSGTFHCEVVG